MHALARTATNPTCVCFGGPDLKTLFVTTAKGRTKTKLPQPVGYGSSVLVAGIGFEPMTFRL
ncbi:SMP-30/gluconolactonase/LRE family protein [Bradyrhizobium sp. HKCCYLR20261]|uniref:SMP-30/gluconolactonase/LRE family protein n=1 Tax=Bradyrhizobium sp. HKCCYLR20261 TaxID=3420760 RepID=UPI003EB7A224